MKIKEYIENPLGGRLTTHRDFYDNLYREKFKKLMVKVNNKINYTLYFTTQTYIVHVKMPSENVDNIFYDIVLEFYPSESHVSITDALKDYDFRFFSNDPWFNFVYAYVFKEKDMLMHDLESKFGEQVFKQKPDITNPNHQTGYIKYLYFAYLLLLQKDILSKKTFVIYGKAYNKLFLLNDVVEVDTMIEKRKNEGDRKKQNDKKKKFEELNPQNKSLISKSVKSINVIKSFGNSTTTKKSKRIK